MRRKMKIFNLHTEPLRISGRSLLDVRCLSSISRTSGSLQRQTDQSPSFKEGRRITRSQE
uniref:Uncharacterized protein n=1 Tax=Romanomermis culicivorax TaxID=13658 RepID=A0A915L5W3_ROMCU